MAAQCDVRAKGFGAGVAFERAFVRVNANVIGQGSGIGHLPVTILATVRSETHRTDWIGGIRNEDLETHNGKDELIGSYLLG